jgi:hypothetical protein
MLVGGVLPQIAVQTLDFKSANEHQKRKKEKRHCGEIGM